MSLPAWADEQLSNELPALRDVGEGQILEFKEEFPAQAHELGKEIAAFATSGRGRILIGVANNGGLAGLPSSDPSSRDKLVERTQGVLRTVRPMVNARILLAIETGMTVLCIDVLQQDEPVFYYDSRPYIRDGRSSRPAEPEEVKERIWAHPSAEFRRRSEEQILKLREASEERARAADALALDSQRRFLDRVCGPRGST